MGRRVFRCPYCDVGDVVRDEHLAIYDMKGKALCLMCGNDLSGSLLGEEIQASYEEVSDEYINDITGYIDVEKIMEEIK